MNPTPSPSRGPRRRIGWFVGGTVAALALGVLASLAQDSRRRGDDRPGSSRSSERGDANTNSHGGSTTNSGPSREGPTDFSAVARTISDRNIFDPERQPRTPGAPRRVTPKPSVRADAPEFGLVGVMNYSRGAFAFFDGNSSDYRKAIQANGTIAGHTVTEIHQNSVKLSAGTNAPIELKIGSRIRKTSDGIWESAAGSTTAFNPVKSADSGSNSEGSGSGSGASSSGSSPAEDEILKRLLKKREQEMK